MDKTVLGLIAAVGAVVPFSSAQAGVSSSDLTAAMEATSFAELLAPIPNAVAILAAADEQGAANPADGIELAQYHHHHHHHYHHHHHHHHWHWYHHHHYYY